MILSGPQKNRADKKQLIILLKNSLRLDFRGRRPSARSSRVSPLVMTMVFYGIMGLSVSATLVTDASPFMYSLLLLSYSMVMMVFAVILEFGHSIIHPDDKEILGFRPVSSRTYFLSRLGNILIFVAMTGSALTLLPSLVGLGLGVKWMFVPVFYGVSLLGNLAGAAMVVLFYTTLLRLVPYRRFQNVLAGAQIAFAFLVFFSYQLIPRLGREFLNAGPEIKTWLYVWPPAWFSAMIQVFMGNHNPDYWILSSLAVGLTTFLFVVAFRRISMQYASLISSMQQGDVSDDEPERLKESVFRIQEGRLLNRFRHPEVQAGYFIAVRMLKRDRSVKMGVYPILGMPLAFFALTILDGGLANPFSGGVVGTTRIGIMMLFFVMAVVVMGMIYSQEWEASWIFHVSPLRSPGHLIQGVKLAVLFRVVIPLYILIGVVYSTQIPLLDAWLYTGSLLIEGLVVFSAVSLAIKSFPFSQPRERGERTRRITVLLLVVPLLGMIILIQHFVSRSFRAWVLMHAGLVLMAFVIERGALKRLNRVLRTVDPV
ncbi:MAG TPA: hypothetical protein ENN03_09480 [bacterium]|nr:hypothetical protein [bacterium]